ncbi:MAG: DUF4230 domain-containing protein [Anaerolineales bacterium]|nr:DUF4230 domain-containing protein [Anaerolineales bacterium]
MKNTVNTIMSAIILIVLAAGVYFIVQTVREATATAAQAAQAPFAGIQQSNYDLQTQMANMLHPTPTIIPDPVTHINAIRSLARLETIQYTVEQVVTAETNQGNLAFAFGNKILIQIHGTVVAGIDMEKMQPQDMQLQGDVLYVKLPPAEILTVTLDENKTEVYTIQDGIFSDIDPNLVLDTLSTGKDKITTAALEDGILTQAQKNAQVYLQQFFIGLGYKAVIFQQ